MLFASSVSFLSSIKERITLNAQTTTQKISGVLLMSLAMEPMRNLNIARTVENQVKPSYLTVVFVSQKWPKPAKWLSMVKKE